MKMIRKFQALVLFISVLLLNGCQAIAGIFKAGVWTGIFIVVAVVGLIIFLISRASSKD